jgi:hypothetical protein
MTRRTLPARRRYDLVDIEFPCRRFIVDYGRYGDGALAEIFVDTSKARLRWGGRRT